MALCMLASENNLCNVTFSNSFEMFSKAILCNVTDMSSLRDSSGAGRGAPDGVATLKVRKGAFDALNKGSGALDKAK